jgi:hypothetical protein
MACVACSATPSCGAFQTRNASSTASSSSPLRVNRRARIVTPATRRGVPEESEDGPTWRDRVTNLKTNGPGDGRGVGRRNRGPRRVIKPSITRKPGDAPAVNSNDARIAAWRAENGVGANEDSVGGGGTIRNDVNTDSSKKKPQPSPWLTTDSETKQYGLLHASTATYPAYATLNTPTKYDDSPLDAVAISATTENLARAFGLDANAAGDPSKYETLVEVALRIHNERVSGDNDTQSAQKKLRKLIGRVMRGSIRSAAPAFLYDAEVETPFVPNPFPDIVKSVESLVKSAVPADLTREVTGTVASELTEWMFGPSSLTSSGGVTVVTIKKCRYLEATQSLGVCTHMCKLPAQDVVLSEFGVPLHVEPCFKTGSCQMHFGKYPPSDE